MIRDRIRGQESKVMAIPRAGVQGQDQGKGKGKEQGQGSGIKGQGHTQGQGQSAISGSRAMFK